MKETVVEIFTPLCYGRTDQFGQTDQFGERTNSDERTNALQSSDVGMTLAAYHEPIVWVLRPAKCI
jgi:hypothetical protein